MFVGTLRENVTLLEKMLKEQNRPAILFGKIIILAI